MNLCASFHSDLTHRMLLNEIRYPIGQLDLALQELEKRPNVTIILEILNLSKCGLKGNKLLAILDENPKVVIDCYIWQDFITLQYGRNARQLMYHYPVNNYPQLWYVMQFHPYAVTIAEPLTFDLDNVRYAMNDFTEEQNTYVRVLPSIGKPTDWTFVDQDDGFNHFWILPENLAPYEPYIDILDLYDSDPSREQALIDAYHSQSYKLPIGVLIKNCNSNIPANMVENDELVKRRLNCKQRCMLGRRGCHYCDMFKRTALLAQSSR